MEHRLNKHLKSKPKHNEHKKRKTHTKKPLIIEKVIANNDSKYPATN